MMKRTTMCGFVAQCEIDREVTLTGWVQRSRNLGGVIFVWMRDKTGIVQVVFDTQSVSAETFALAETLRTEYVVGVRGVVKARAQDAINPSMTTGHIEVIVTDAEIINTAETPPIYIDDNAHENEAVRLKYRYLDLRRPSMQATLMTRSKVLRTLRNHFDSEGFNEVETPILTKSTPEGARDYLVPSRVHPGEFYALPQSPQIYKQLLMLAGFDKYYQVARCFRDEDNRADRQPEFTQLDLEMSFVEPQDVQSAVEGAFVRVFKEVMDIEIALPLPRMTWREAMERYGSDKPDTRYGLEITDISEIVKDSGFTVFESAIVNGGSVRGICAQGAASFSRKEFDALAEFVKTYRAKGLAWAAIGEDGVVKSSFAKNIAPDTIDAIREVMHAHNGDAMFFIADQHPVVFAALGALRQHLARKLNMIDHAKYNLMWVTEFPLLEYDAEDNRFVAMHHPFTAPMLADAPKMDTAPGEVRAQAYDLVLNGVEMGSGSIRIHARDMQMRMFNLLGFTPDEAQARFGFLLEAFEYGTPPHGGFAFGIDRLVMILCGKDSLRDVIAFPKVQNASCLMMDTPSVVQDGQLSALHIRTALD